MKKSESKTRLGHQAWGDLYCINYTAGGEKFKIFCYFVFSKLGEILEGKLLQKQPRAVNFERPFQAEV